MKFEYQARTKEGELQVGVVEAASKEMAATILSGHNLFILRIEETGEASLAQRIVAIFNRVKRKDMVIFSRQLSTLLEAHLSLEKALNMLFEQTTSPILKEVVLQISQDVASGLSFSQALEHHPHIFSQFFISMIRSAEVTGRLTEVSGFLADYTEQEANLIEKARGALTYPFILMGLFVIVAGIMVAFVFPQIAPVFTESGVKLPLFSRIMIGIGLFLSKYWFIVVILVGFVVIGTLDYFRTKEGRALKDDLKIHMPILWRVYVPITLTRFGNASQMLIKGGVPLAQAMEIVAETIDNVVYQDALHEVASDLRSGVLLSEALGRHPDYFPAIVTQMVAVGEVTGQLDQIFTRITGFYQREADSVVGNLVELIQPLLLVVMGILIAFLFASILLPIYQLTATIN
jgi:type IV pilus assembly protein PilC